MHGLKLNLKIRESPTIYYVSKVRAEEVNSKFLTNYSGDLPNLNCPSTDLISHDFKNHVVNLAKTYTEI